MSDVASGGDEAETAGRETTVSDSSEVVTENRSETDGASRLANLRQDPRRRLLITVAGVVLGLAVALVHWIGFIIGGALVALPQRTVLHGVAAGVGFGVLAWLVFLATLARVGAVDTYLQMGQILVLSTLTPIVGALLGSLIRGIE